MNNEKNIADMSFEELMASLKTTLDSLEKGDLSLEESMKTYENGVVLVRNLEDKLKKMEGRMEEIMADGTIKELHVPLAEDERHERA